MNARKLTNHERQLLDRLLEIDFPGCEAIAAQVNASLVRQLDSHGCLEFEIEDGPPIVTPFRIPVEAEFEDIDGILGHILLHVVSGKVKSLEIYKNDSSDVIRLPAPSELRLFHPK